MPTAARAKSTTEVVENQPLPVVVVMSHPLPVEVVESPPLPVDDEMYDWSGPLAKDNSDITGEVKMRVQFIRVEDEPLPIPD